MASIFDKSAVSGKFINHFKSELSMLNEVSAKRLDEKSPLGLYLATLGAAA
jgi:hypothetical protein